MAGSTSDRSERGGTSAPIALVHCEADLLCVALDLAARHGDRRPDLVEHTVGTREAATRVTGSWVDDVEPSYLAAMRGAFTARRASPPSARLARRDDATVAYPVQVFVVAIASGRITDSGGGVEYPDLAVVGPVVTDFRAGERLTPAPDVRRLLDVHRREVVAAAEATRAARAPVSVSYRGAATIGSPGRARLHGPPGNLGDLVWQALGDAGWLGQTARLHPLIEASLSVPQAPPHRNARSGLDPLDGGARSLLEGGRRSDDGRVHQGYGGPLNRRAVTGVRLIDSERLAEDWDAYVDMLYTAAVRAGWLEAPTVTHADIPDTEIVLRSPRRAD